MRQEARVNAVYDQLTANERELVSHILQEKQQVRGMNSTQLAQHLHVSRTTLVRFWKKLGVQSYAEFRLLLQQDQRELDAPGVELADSLCGPPSESGIAQELVRRHILPAPPQTQKGA